MRAHLGVHLGSSGARVLQLLEHQHAGALAHDKAVAAGVKWPGCARRSVIVARRQRLEPREAAKRDRVNA